MSKIDVKEEAEKIRQKADKQSAGDQLGGTFHGQERDAGMTATSGRKTANG
ncbi:hypothetical protein [Roseibium limicola]|uniref:Uncharacterized protein n=1 Tax=Roseibium limicola TaxID=2816037 RepID=A0A939ELW2_9HYPH|nr:hypothetical protein [Roseibium limicola]MBO0344236.1 hypothetical protein [Roseibium limicola]